MYENFINKNGKTFIVAEIGANHNGDLELAKKSIEEAYRCGVDAVKFQTYSSKELLADKDRVITWGKNGEVSENIASMFDRIALKRDYHKELFEYAKSFGLIPFSTPFSVDGVDFLVNELDVPFIKIAASDVNYIDMLKKIGKTKKTAMLSLGKCTLAEADIAIKTLIENGCEKLVIMHCVSNYPSKMEDMNLNIIKSLKMMYPDCIVGFSDHSLGITAALVAVAFGAKVVEKHFTIDNDLYGPDHWFSMNPKTMKSLVDEIRNLEVAMGSYNKDIVNSELDERKTSIRSVVLNRNVNKNHIIEESDLKVVRPGYGISPYDKEKLIGLKVNKDLKEDTVLLWDYFK